MYFSIILHYNETGGYRYNISLNVIGIDVLVTKRAMHGEV